MLQVRLRFATRDSKEHSLWGLPATFGGNFSAEGRKSGVFALATADPPDACTPPADLLQYAGPDCCLRNIEAISY